jgi:DNA-binding MarR family transcriptional regulator
MAATVPERTVPDISFLLSHTAHVLTTRMTAAFAELGISPRAFCVLVHAAQGQCAQIELAKLADLDKTTMVVTLDELEAAGYARRLPSGRDRRARIIEVTATGQRIIDAGQRIADRVHGEVLAALPPGQGEALADALATLAGGLLAAPADCSRPIRRARLPRQLDL